MPLIVSTEDFSHGTLLHIQGEMDLATAHDLESHLNRHLDQGDGVIVDLSEVSYLDMSGVRVFERFATIFREKNRSLVIATPSQIVQLVFKIINFHDVPIAKNRDEALALLRRAD